MNTPSLPKLCSELDGMKLCLMVLATTVVVQLGVIVALVYFMLVRLPAVAPSPIVITAPAPTLPVVPTSPVAPAQPPTPVPAPKAAVSIQPPAPPIAPAPAAVAPTPPVMAAPPTMVPESSSVRITPLNAQVLSQQLDAQIADTALLDSAERVCGYKAPEPNATLTAFINQADSTAQQCQQACTGFLALQNEWGGKIKMGLSLPLERLPADQQSTWQNQFAQYNQGVCQLRLPTLQALEELKVQGGVIFGMGSPGMELLDLCAQLTVLQALCPSPDPT